MIAALLSLLLSAGPDDALRTWLDRAGVFGWSGAVAVLRDGHVSLKAVHGLANRGTGAQITSSTPFYVASLSKQFTATAILALSVDGRLRVEDSLHRFFPDAPAATRDITIHHLLTHTSGIARGSDIAATVSADYARILLSRPARSAPGTQYGYSNDGYALLAAIVEQVSGRRFSEFLRDRLFAPAGLRHTFVVNDRPAPLPGTRAYRGGLDMGDVTAAHGAPVRWAALGGTGIVTSLDDLIRWEQALASGSLLPRAALERMWTPEREGYGYGWVIRRTVRGTRMIVHDGLLFPEGWNAEYRRFPDDGVTLIVLSNVFQEDALGHTVARELTRLVFGGAVTWPPDARPAPASHLGRHPVAPGSAFVIDSHAGGITLRAEGQAAVNYLTSGQIDTLRYRAENARTERLIAALASRQLRSVTADLGATRTPEQWERTLYPLWDSLASRHGAYRRGRSLHSVPFGGDTSRVVSYAELWFGTDERPLRVVVRYTWAGDTLEGASDWGSFPGSIRQVEVTPGPMPLGVDGAGRWVIWNMATGVSRWEPAPPGPSEGARGARRPSS